MKPIKLVIEGLNSFEQKQTIDFERLTRQGFFGIFGPTGSGKSTILDGITLALYGDESRNSADFINVNVDRAMVSFEFQISGEQNRHYWVQREFKRDKNTLKPRSGKCKLVDITYEPAEVLEENVTAITKRCTEILGLTKDDFTRTVVLPQGKFSEFLKMEGRQRRDMLERLFNLYEYGEQLKNKLSRAMEAKKETLFQLEGELKGVGAVDQTVVDEQKAIVGTLSQSLMEHETVLVTLKAQLEDEKALIALEDECLRYEQQMRDHLSAEAEMMSNKEALKRYLNAQTLEDTVKNFDELCEDVNKRQGQQETDLQFLKEQEMAVEKIKQSLELTKYDYEQERPNWMIQHRQLMEALDTLKEMKKKEQALLEVEVKSVELKKGLKSNESKVLICEQQMAKGQLYVKDIEKQLEDHRVTSEEMAEVQDGKLLQLEIEKDGKLLNQYLEKLKVLTSTLKQTSSQMEADLEKFGALETQYLLLKEQRETHLMHCPGNAQTLAELVKTQYERQSLWNSYETAMRQLKETQESMTLCECDLKRTQDALSDLEKQRLLNIERRETFQKIQMVVALQATLKDSELCPVCGSKDHDLSLVHVSYDDAEWRLLLDEGTDIEKKEMDLEKTINKCTAQLDLFRSQIATYKAQLDALGTDFLSETVEAIEARRMRLESEIAIFESKKIELDALIENTEKRLNEGKSNLQINRHHVETTEQQIKELQLTLEPLEENLMHQKAVLESLKTKLRVTDFVLYAQQLHEKTQVLEKLEVMYKKSLIKLDEYRQEKEKAKDEMTEQMRQLTELETRYAAEKDQTMAMKRALSEKVGQIDTLEEDILVLSNKIKTVTEAYQTLTTAYENDSKAYEMTRMQFLKNQQSLEDLRKRYENDKEMLEQSLLKYGFTDLMTLRANFKSLDFIKRLEDELQVYETAGQELKIKMHTLKTKMNGRTVDRSDHETHLSQCAEQERLVKIIHEQWIGAKKTLETFEHKATQVKKLLEKQSALNHTMGILKDLESLFKGNKFVEFVAIERLKYISKEASEKLYEITSGAYGLVTDDNGRFLIKDNKNGGVLRETSTLSGGETFLASLALALALSSEIQLKGTAPLELFFLDEGFGTLDDQLLDVLMTSLERIHHEKLKIGLISHVDSVKNRVPVSLTIVPAGAGEGGSQIVASER